MNDREHWERQLLLAASGELDAAEQADLDRALAADPALARLAEEQRVLLNVVRTAWTATGPSPAARERIRQAAREQARKQAQRRFRWPLAPVWRPILAAAAGLVVAVSAWLWTPHSTEIASPDRVGEMHALVTVILEADASTAETVSPDSEARHLQALAQRLLTMQGLQFDELDDDWGDYDGPAAPAGTRLQPDSGAGMV